MVYKIWCSVCDTAGVVVDTTHASCLGVPGLIPEVFLSLSTSFTEGCDLFPYHSLLFHWLF
jgi:hypothetical protein